MSSNSPSPAEDLLVKRWEQMYLYLHRQYRLGNFEETVGYAFKWRECDEEFYALCDPREAAKANTITFPAAIHSLCRLLNHIDKHRQDIAESHAVLMLRCRCLIYEATDYLQEVPDHLGTYFAGYAESFVWQVRAVEQAAEALNGKPEIFVTKDDRTRVMKLQLIAVLCGANEIYRRHNGAAYETCHRILTDVNHFVETELPRQHGERRDSLGLLGISNYLTGRVLSGKGQFLESLNAFRRSKEAYLARLRQKEELYRNGLISKETYEEKVSVTVRRAALVSAFGDGYHYFVNGQLSRALESLTLARAALMQNSGDVYLTYVDMFYWACKRAKHSSNLDTLNECVAGLSQARARFFELSPHSHYFHRAGIQLSLALFSRAQINSTVPSSDFEAGLQCLDEAIAYAQGENSDGVRNTHMLATAWAIKARYLISRYQESKKPRKSALDHRYLEAARIAVCHAEAVTGGMKMLRCEVLTTLAEVYIDLAEVHTRYQKHEFRHYFDAAVKVLDEALELNAGENIRNEAVCLLRFTKLYLLSPHTLRLAHDAFERWRRISNRVEHEYCQSLAAQIQSELHSPVLLVDPWKRSQISHWNQEVLRFLLDEALNKFVNKHRRQNLTPLQLKKDLIRHLRGELGYGDTKVRDLIRDRDLEVRVCRMMEDPLYQDLPISPPKKHRR